MKTLWILAAAATFAACHSRSNEETGAAPDRGDTTAVSGYDTTTTVQPTAPSADTTTAQPTTPSADTTMGAPSADTTAQPAPPSAGYDTTTAQPAPPSAGYDTTSTAVPSPTTDTTMAPGAGAVDTAR